MAASPGTAVGTGGTAGGTGGGRAGLSHLQQTGNTQQHLRAWQGWACTTCCPQGSRDSFIQFFQPLHAGAKWGKQNSSNIHALGSRGGDSSTMPPGEQPVPVWMVKGSATKLCSHSAGKARTPWGRRQRGDLKPKYRKLAGAPKILEQECHPDF